MRTILNSIVLLFCVYSFAQTTVEGNVSDENGQPVAGANILVVGTSSGTVTDFDGAFSLTVDLDPPFTLQISMVGFDTATQEVTSNNQTFNIQLSEGNELDEVIISASRTPERIFESPVTVERFGIKDIKNTASADFYDGLENLKGVDINTNSLTFKAINTRGFATFANTRFMQLVDGMDNSAPALNFPLGNLLGMTETDVQSIEILPGAASALYGANAFNGILFMRSKSPFDHQGISGYYKQGMTSQDAAGDNTYTDFGLRAAYKFSDKFAAKVNFAYLKGTDWMATNYSARPGTGSSRSDLNYNGINVYGDEVSSNIRGVAEKLIELGLLPPGVDALVPDENVSRYGYREEDLTDYNAESVKADWSLNYRPWGDDFEIIYQGKVGGGSTVYQGTNRYAINDFSMTQNKLEVKNDNFFVRGYVTEDKAGDSYDMLFTGININRKWKDDSTWFGEYVASYLTAFSGALAPAPPFGLGIPGGNVEAAHAFGREVAEEAIDFDPTNTTNPFTDDGIERLIPGTPEFEEAFNTVTNDPDLNSGSKFQDNSKFYHIDANYNFSHLIEFADIQVGGSYRNYELNSFGTIYTDADGPINYYEYGIYTQIQKTLDEQERLKFTGSIRYDKSEFFDGFVSPRVSLGYTAGFEKNHNFRASYQTGFRNPTTQDLFIGLNAGAAILVGSAPDNLDRYTATSKDLSGTGFGLLGVENVPLNGRDAYTNSYSAASVAAAVDTGDLSLLQAGNPELVKPEKVTSYEFGYRGKFNKTIVDLSAYYNSYEDFISNEVVLVPFYGEVGDASLSVLALLNDDFQPYQAYTNSAADVNSYGASIAVSTKVFGGYDLSFNYTYAKEDFDQKSDPDFVTNFNTPEHKFKARFGNTNLFDNFGFNVAWRWSDTYLWQNAFATGPIPAFNVLDAQVNLRVPSLKSTFKLGASNVLGDEYYTAVGTGFIGSMFYASWVINNL
jgi:outer membrane receptor protein involved in Fe transport